MAGGENQKNRAMYTREGRKQLFAVLQGARGSSGDWLCPNMNLGNLFQRILQLCFFLEWSEIFMWLFVLNGIY